MGCATLLLASLAGPAFARSTSAVLSEPPAYTWIFAGVLPATLETFSGTLVASETRSEFELILADGSTCDGARLDGETGVVRLHELTCSDGRTMHATFLSKGGTELRVFGHVGDEEFIVDAHLLDFEAPNEGVGRGLWPPALPPIPAPRASIHKPPSVPTAPVSTP